MLMVINSGSKVLAFVGDGEGKTSAAIGHAVRAGGHGKKVAVVQFLKGRDSTGEFCFLKDCSQKGIEVFLAGEKGFLLDQTPKQPHIEKAKEGISLTKTLISSRKYFLIVLDELLDAQAAGIISTEDIEEILNKASASCQNLILTGRILPPELSTRVDLITRMQKIKHYFDKGEKGIEGLDW